jgi:hypothetical protein
MSIIKNLFERKATTVAAIQDKLRELETANPLADVERLQNERRALLLSDDEGKVVKLEQQIAVAHREEDRRVLAIEAVRKQLAEAEQVEHQAEVTRRVAAAKRALKKMPDLLAVYETAAKQIEDVLEGIDHVQEVINLANAALPSGEQLPSAEFQFRGGIAPEPRREVSRKTVGEFWVLADGQEVPSKLLETLKLDDDAAPPSR